MKNKFTWSEICDKAEQTEERKWLKAKDNAREEVREMILQMHEFDIEDADSPEGIIEHFLENNEVFFDDNGHAI